MDVKAVRLTANAIRGLAMDAVQSAESGHPGMPMGMAEAAVVLWSSALTFDPDEPAWPNRDRFVLSAGHGSMLLYALLHLSGYDLSITEIKKFRQWDSLTPGHPEFLLTPGVEATTGPLGQGFANGVGMAIAERCLAARFNQPNIELIDHYIYVLAGDGCLMEGITHEAGALAGHLGLGRLIVMWDNNGISIDGETTLASSENISQRFSAYGWHTVEADGHDPDSVYAALSESRADSKRPSLISCRTVIGYGSPNRAGTNSVHGEPLGTEEVVLTKVALNLDPEKSFQIQDGADVVLRRAAVRGAQRRDKWMTLLSEYEASYPELSAEFRRSLMGDNSGDIDSEIPDFSEVDTIATRAASGKVLESLCGNIPHLIGGSADLTGSNNTRVPGMKTVVAGDFSGRYIHYGVREHAMGGVLNGLALHGGMIPYGGTFLVFSDYMRPSIRLAAMMGLHVIYVFSHDSIGIGEDGPTHQPVEHLVALRAIPGLTVIRPADALETAESWRVAIKRLDGPTALILTRQKVPVLKRGTETGLASARGVCEGAYVLADCGDPDVILIGSGSEVHVALAARTLLVERGIQARVVSMPSWELYEAASSEIREKVLPADIRARVAIEAGVRIGWERYVGAHGVIVGIDRFGASAPGEVMLREYGMTAVAVADAAQELL